MTFYEHAMLGATLALAGGVHRKQGWGLVATAAFAAAVPDWDGLSLLFGPTAYAQAHRLWGHNLLASSLGGAATGACGYLCYLSAGVRRRTVAMLARLEPRWRGGDSYSVSYSASALAVWVSVGVVAGLTHLPADVIYSGAPGLASWPLQPLWPFAERPWNYPIVPWGDLVTTFIFIAEMFAWMRWPGRAQLIAAATLLLITAYVVLRAVIQA